MAFSASPIWGLGKVEMRTITAVSILSVAFLFGGPQSGNAQGFFEKFSEDLDKVTGAVTDAISGDENKETSENVECAGPDKATGSSLGAPVGGVIA